MTIRRFTAIWEGLVEPAWTGDVTNQQPSRVLNIIMLLLLLWGVVFGFQLWSRSSTAWQYR